LNKTFKDLILSIIASLIASFLWNYATISFQMKAFSRIDHFLKLISSYQFIGYWFAFLLFVLGLKHIIRNKIDQKQEPYPLIFSIPFKYDFKGEVKYEGFLWKLKGKTKSSQWIHRDLFEKESKNKEVEISAVDGPYCLHDYRKMKEQRTYFGFFKYTCTKCGYKKKLLKSSWTLECELKDEIESEQRMGNRSIIDSNE
jgi:predicted membrane protein